MHVYPSLIVELHLMLVHACMHSNSILSFARSKCIHDVQCANPGTVILLTLGAHAQRGLQQLSCVVCLSVCYPYSSKLSNSASYQKFQRS